MTYGRYDVERPIPKMPRPETPEERTARGKAARAAWEEARVIAQIPAAKPGPYFPAIEVSIHGLTLETKSRRRKQRNRYNNQRGKR
jgi:hypothetical protein